ncbi:hypothetical protein L208DRAFT_1385555 [Tricholoma matsutake]|nr:hypothetical protein L208DRAFT_1385555 [Tricholoma matsutake 945]
MFLVSWAYPTILISISISISSYHTHRVEYDNHPAPHLKSYEQSSHSHVTPTSTISTGGHLVKFKNPFRHQALHT